MKLKKLEVTGFKSFPDKVAIQFPLGISAVVGPNGCGKSNLVDALRWVMGEQSVKQLRGKSMEDVIFSGTNGKPPLNMAEVSLTLLNDNGSAPEELRDFTEIMVTRKLFRSGESGYFINKQPCRLKDIHNIFLGSGMGARTYAVIQQGNIGAITDASPEERRLFIEEAAGITRYKARKNEALRKVAATNQNLLRINDIVAELDRQMAGLKRQANKAVRFKKYREEVRDLDVHLALHDDQTFDQQISETQGLLETLNAADLAHTAQLQKVDAAIEAIKLQRTQKNQEIASQKAQHFEIQRKIDRTEADTEHYRQDTERLAQEVTALESTLIDLEQKNHVIQQEIEQGQTEKEAFQASLQTLEQELQQDRQSARNEQETLNALNQRLDQRKAELMELVAQEARYKNIYQTATSNQANLKKRLQRIEDEEIQAHKSVQNAVRQEETAQGAMDQAQAAHQQLQQRIAAVRETLDQHNTALASQVKRAQKLELEYNKAKSKYATFKKMEANFEWYRDGVRAIMQACQTPDDSSAPRGAQPTLDAERIAGLMVDILEPEPRYQLALESVLGESLQYVLVKDQSSALASIDYLQTQAAGRSGFLPIDAVRALPASDTPPPKDVEPLLQHIRVKAGYEDLAQALLGHVMVSESLPDALELHNRNGRLQTIVTKDGHIISPHGAIVGGSRDKLAGLLEKKQSLKKWRRLTHDLDQRLARARDEQTVLENEVRQIEIKLQQLVEQQHQATQREVESEKALYKATEDVKYARQHLEIVQLEHEQLLGEASDIDDEMSQYNRALDKIARSVKDAQDQLAQMTADISGHTARVDQAQQQIVELQLKHTALNSQLESSDHSLNRLRVFYEDGLARYDQVRTEIEQKTRKGAAHTENIATAKRTLAEMYQHLNQISKVIASNEDDFENIETQLQQNDSVIADIQTQRAQALEKIRLLEIELSELKLRRENNRQRIFERYHHDLDTLQREIEHREKPLEMSREEMETQLERLQLRIRRIGDVNLGAIQEYDHLKTRYDFLVDQRDDLVAAIEDLHRVVRKINRITQKRFVETFNAVNAKLGEVFPRLFEGGSAKLVLTEPDKPLESGVEFMIHPPGKKLTRMSLLSGGEKALSAISLIFSIFLIRPASFCLMDEIDAPLDDVNIQRFNELLKIIGAKSQIIMITHNKNSMEFADTLFGITMERKGVSKVVSVNFETAAAQGA